MFDDNVREIVYKGWLSHVAGTGHTNCDSDDTYRTDVPMEWKQLR